MEADGSGYGADMCGDEGERTACGSSVYTSKDEDIFSQFEREFVHVSDGLGRL